MSAKRNFEIGTGLFVLLGLGALLFLTTQLPSSGLKFKSAAAGYRVTAAFDDVGDLKAGSPVTMAGVTLGQVESIRIDWHSYKAVVTMRIDSKYNQIPDDSDASIETQGLLGGKYIGLGAGGSETYLKDGSRITLTQSALVLENLINKFFASSASKGGEAGSSSGQASAPGAQGLKESGK